MTITLPVTKRDNAQKTSAVRANGDIPAVVYGPKQEAVAITLPAKTFDKIRKEASESTIVELTGLEEPLEVLIKDIEFNPVKQEVMHVDFYAIERGKDMTTDVPLAFIGEAPAEKVGSVTRVLHEVTVTCRPSNLPGHIDVDLSALKTIEDKIHVSDLKVGEGVVIDTPADEVVAVISVAREESDEDVEPVDMDAIEVEEKGKADAAEE